MQSIKPGTFKNKIQFDLFLKAHERAKKSKGQKYEILKFEKNLEVNLFNLMKEIKSDNYHVGKYHEFTIYEPKERIIKSLPYRDRIVHQWYVNEFIIPYFCPRFINDSYACIKNKGTHRASYKLRKMIKSQYNKKYFFIKGDIKKYFYNIDKNILLDIFRKKSKDKDLNKFTKLLLFDNDKNPIGLPIGNYTSQYFANIYLNKLDYYIKCELGIKCYVRYMDDFILIINNKTEASKIILKIKKFLMLYLNLQLNHKTRIIPGYLGIDFVGYKIIREIVRIRKHSLIHINNNLNITSFNSFYAHAKHACERHTINYYKNLLNYK